MTAAISVGTGLAIAGGVGAAGAVAGGILQANAAGKAASVASNENNYINQMEAPYVQSGDEAESELNYLMGIGPKKGGTGTYGSLNQPFNTSDWKSLSPAYGFQLQQGQQGVLNGASSSQGGLSGAAQTALQNQNQAIASTSFDNAFNMYQTQNQNIYNRLAGVAQLGQAAAGNNASAGVGLAGTQANAAIAQGQAAGSAATGVANAIGSGYQNAALYSAYGAGGYNNPNNLNGVGGQTDTYYTADGTPYTGTVASGGF